MQERGYLVLLAITGGDYLLDLASGSRYSKNAHSADPPANGGNTTHSFSIGKGSSVIMINKLRYWTLDAVLNDKYLFPTTVLASFVPLLRLQPDECAKASDLSYYNWL